MQPLLKRLATAPRNRLPSEPIPIAFTITDLDVGGAERALVSLATRLDQSIWKPEVVCLDDEGALADVLRASDVPTTCLNASPRRPLQAVARLIRELRRIRPAIVQSFLFHANVATRLAAPFAGRPWVIGGLRVAEKGKAFHLRLDAATQALSLGAVCVSKGVAAHAVASGGLNPERLTVIPNGVDVSSLDAATPVDRASIKVPERATLALFVGRLEHQKGVDVLLSAARKVAEVRSDWYLALVGDGPEAGSLLATVCDDRRLSERVRLLGRRSDVPSLLKTCDYFVLPSRWEGMPNALLEAMAAGKAAVASAVEGCDELIDSGRSGLLVPPADAGALAVALAEAASDPERLRAWGEAGRARVERDHSPWEVARKYQELWLRVSGYETPMESATIKQSSAN